MEEALTYSRPYGVAELMERAVADARRTAEETERVAVVTEVKELILRSGLSQAEFASRIGTSASRLSTYATGKVVPSATLLVRMRRVGKHEGGFASLAEVWRGQVKIEEDFDELSPHNIELAEALLRLTPEERLRALRPYARLQATRALDS